MSYDEKTGKIDWKDEYSWVAISLISGLVLSFIYLYFNRFPNANHVAVISICCIGESFMSIHDISLGGQCKNFTFGYT